MSKRIFVLLIVLMSLSLIGIIFVQAYYIQRVVDNERQRFEQNTKMALVNVSNTIEKSELDGYYEKFQNLLVTEKNLDSVTVSRLVFSQEKIGRASCRERVWRS